LGLAGTAEMNPIFAGFPKQRDVIEFPVAMKPNLLVMVDAEEEFDWRNFSATATSVSAMRHQDRAQRIFERYNVVPTYSVDYPVASQKDGYEPLLGFLDDGRCQIGAQLHPWVNPPIEEEIGEENSFPGNLPYDLEYRKLERLTRIIEDNFAITPRIYRAGRYGLGINTPDILKALGYRIDCSILPHFDLRRQTGPDFREFSSQPFWFGRDGDLLELPATVGIIGGLTRHHANLYHPVSSPVGQAVRVPAMLARLRLIDRIRLTPEGSSIDEAKRLTRNMLVQGGHRIFIVSYHSPSLVPGHTPYVKTQNDLDRFLAWIDEYLDFFFHEIGGVPSTPSMIRDKALAFRGPLSPAVRNQSQFQHIRCAAAVPPRLADKASASHPTVSVVIPCYNSSQTISRALRSVRNGTLQPTEVIIVDDASTDDLRSALAEERAPPVTVISLAERSGAAHARNVGVEAASGEFIAFLDSDDEWHETKLAKQIALLISNPSLAYVSCRGRHLAPDLSFVGNFPDGGVVVGLEAWRALLAKNFISTPCVVARRCAFVAVGGFNPTLPIAEDQDLWIRMALVGEVGFIYEDLVTVHQRHNSLTREYRNRELRVLVPWIGSLVQRLRGRLGYREVRRILAQRYTQFGRNAYPGQFWSGLALILRAVVLGDRPLGNLWYLITASPPSRWAKTTLGLRGPASRPT
jgi:glycosyltransferase involved in cell wall biosynthesis